MAMNAIASLVYNCAASLVSIIQVCLSSSFFIRFKKTDGRKEIFILGNGPSLQTNLARDIDFLKNQTVLCVNGFALSEAYPLLKPAYYLMADEAFWNYDELTEKTKKIVSEVTSSLVEKTTWDVMLLLPVKAKKYPHFITGILSNQHIRIQYFNTTPVKGFTQLCHFLLRHNLGIPSAQNVIIPGLMIAINLGYEKVYLLGADHSWHENYFIDDENRVCLKDVHFYEPAPRFTPLLYKGRPVKLYEQFESLARVFRIYHFIQTYARSQNVVIYNASEKSYIDAFERISMEKVKENFSVHLT